MINVGSAGWPTRGVPQIAVLSPRNIRHVLNASTEALVDGLSHYRVETQVFDTWVSREAGVRDLLRGRFDAVLRLSVRNWSRAPTTGTSTSSIC